MPKVTIIGSGNVGSLAAMRIAEANLADVVLIDVNADMPEGKAFDLEDAAWLMRHNRAVSGTDRYDAAANSDVIVVTAGLARKPGMTREDLAQKNAEIIRDISKKIKKILSIETVVVVVTNPLDIMTQLVVRSLGIDPKRILGMGLNLDASRFAQLIHKETKCIFTEIQPVVIGSHGKTMLPLPRLTYVKGKPLTELLSKDKVNELVEKTRQRGAEIVSRLKNGSAFFAPAAAIYGIVKAIVLDEKRTIGVAAYLTGQYGLKDICIGVPAVIGRAGIENIIELDLNAAEKKLFYESAKEIQACMISA